MWNSSRRSCAFFAIFLLVSVSLLAFPGRYTEPEIGEAKELQEILIELPEVSLEELPVPVEEEVSPVVEETLPLESSESSQESISTELLNMLEDYEQTSKLNKKELEQLIAKLEIIKSEYEIICDDLEAKELQIDELAVLNGKQADDLAYLRGAYDKETGVKAFANVGAVIGFKDNLPTWGLSSALGMRFGKGLLLECGAQYMIGNFTSQPVLNWSLDNLAITTSIGWEW